MSNQASQETREESINNAGITRRATLGAIAVLGSAAGQPVGGTRRIGSISEAVQLNIGTVIGSDAEIRLADRSGVWRKWTASSPKLTAAHEGYSWFTDAAHTHWHYVSESGEVRADAVGVKADNIHDDWFALTVAESLLPADGGVLSLPSGIIRLTRPLALTKRQSRVVGRSFHETYLKLAKAAPSTIAPWATSTDYRVGDLRTYYESGHDNAVPYLCISDHKSASFAADWGLGNWEQWCAISVRASDCSVELCNIQIPASGIGISVQGAARFSSKNSMFVPEINLASIGLLLDDRDHLGVFSPGSYNHMIGPGNGFASLSQGKTQFLKGIASAGTDGGINASRVHYNYFVGDMCAHIQAGGGNAYVGNLMQSATGANSGSRPFSGGVGIGVKFGGETHFDVNYFERFAYDFQPSTSSALYTVTGHSSDATNDFFPVRGSYGSPSFVVTGNGVAAEVVDGMGFVVQNLSKNNEEIEPKLRGLTVSGNGQARSGITISSSGARVGQRLLIHGNSWPFQILGGGNVDLGERSPTLTIGEAKTFVDGYQTECSFAEFIFTVSLMWRLLWCADHSAAVGALVLESDNSVITSTVRCLDVSGGSSPRIGVVIGDGRRPGDRLLLTATGMGFSFASAAAHWGHGGPPQMGKGPGHVMCLELLWTKRGWIEIGRTANL